MTVSTSAAEATSAIWAGSTPAVAHRVEPHGDEVGPCADLEPAGVGPAERAVRRQRRGQLVRGEPAPLQRLRTLVALEQLRLAEQVDQHVLVGAERERHARVAKRDGRCDAVGEVVFGRRADAHGGAGRGELCDVVGVDVHGVHGARLR